MLAINKHFLSILRDVWILLTHSDCRSRTTVSDKASFSSFSTLMRSWTLVLSNNWSNQTPKCWKKELKKIPTEVINPDFSDFPGGQIAHTWTTFDLPLQSLGYNGSNEHRNRRRLAFFLPKWPYRKNFDVIVFRGIVNSDVRERESDVCSFISVFYDLQQLALVSGWEVVFEDAWTIILWRVSQDICKEEQPFQSQADPQWRQEV